MGRPEGKRQLGRLRHRWEDNIKIDLEEVRIHWIDLPHDWNLLASQEGLSYLQLF